MPDSPYPIFGPGFFLILGLHTFIKAAFPVAGNARVVNRSARYLGLLMMLPALVVWGGFVINTFTTTSADQSATVIRTLSDMAQVSVYTLAFGLVTLYLILRASRPESP